MKYGVKQLWQKYCYGKGNKKSQFYLKKNNI